jgi:hypothetical protein
MYELAKRLKAKRIIVVSAKAEVKKAWQDDIEGHKDFVDWNFFISTDKTDKNFAHFIKHNENSGKTAVVFASFQDLMGEEADREIKTRHECIYKEKWDLLLIDETHYGARTKKAGAIINPNEEPEDAAAETIEHEEVVLLTKRLTSDLTVHLSGTPYAILASNEFPEEAVFTWTYEQEQAEKQKRIEQDIKDNDNPYIELPELLTFAEEIPNSLKTKIEEELTDSGDTFSLSEMFKARGTRFNHEEAVVAWLKMIQSDEETGDKIFGVLENSKFAGKLKHIVFVLPSVASCKAMKKLITDVFINAVDNDTWRLAKYNPVVTAGDNDGDSGAAIDLVKENIKRGYTLTLTCGKLLTGITIAEWDGIFMLANIHSAERYWQAAFRVQSPFMMRDEDKNKVILKPQSYVFDYDLGRLLEVIEEKSWAEAKRKSKMPGSAETEKAIAEHLKFSPIITNSGLGLVQLKSNNVLDIIAKNFSTADLYVRWSRKNIITINPQNADWIFRDGQIRDFFKQLDELVNRKGAHRALFEAFEGSENVETGKDSKITKGKRGESPENEGETLKLLEVLRTFIPRLMLYVYLSEADEENTEVIANTRDKEDQALFFIITKLTTKLFLKIMEKCVYDKRDLDREIRNFTRTVEEYEIGSWYE